jgi:hypothetical protein
LRGDVKTRTGGLDEVLAELDEAAYAPGGANAEIASALRKTALAAADAIVEEAR